MRATGLRTLRGKMRGMTSWIVATTGKVVGPGDMYMGTCKTATPAARAKGAKRILPDRDRGLMFAVTKDMRSEEGTAALPLSVQKTTKSRSNWVSWVNKLREYVPTPLPSIIRASNPSRNLAPRRRNGQDPGGPTYLALCPRTYLILPEAS